jgi:hypothetical protein
MDILTSMPFLGGDSCGSGGTQISPLLGRFLPPVPTGIARAWLTGQAASPGLILDPFGGSPHFTAEAAAAGRRVLVAANNPVTRFLVELTADPPSEADFRAALAELASARKGEERLEQHILSIYETPCANCGREISADAFVWEAAGGSLTRRIYTCPHCGDSGERSAVPADIERAARFAAGDAMHRSRVLARVAPPGDPDRSHAEEALHVYLPRAVYALGTLINRIDQLSLPPARMRALHALILHACDAASALWSYGPDRPRPRSLQLPTAFRENNVWKAMEMRLAQGTTDEKTARLKVTTWPDLPPETGGLSVFEGALRDLVPQLGELRLAAAIGVFPRPNPAFWILSALWAGWLWGREAAAPFKSVLRRRRYDWQWHAEALRAAVSSLAEALKPGAPFFALLAEAEPAFVSAALSAAGEATFVLEGMAMRTADDPLQFIWRVREKGLPATTPFDRSIVRSALEGVLDARAEPVTYLHSYTVGSAALAGANALPLADELSHETAAAVQDGLKDPIFVRYRARGGAESGLWGLARPGEEFVALSDRVEMAVVRFVGANPGCTSDVLCAQMSHQFPGLLTPSLGLVSAVLESYAVDDHGWRLREEDSPSRLNSPSPDGGLRLEGRRGEMQAIMQMLEDLGERLEYHVLVQDGNLVVWEDGLDTFAAFFVQASAVLERVLRVNKYPSEKTVLVIPGGRAGLLAYKLRRDPYLGDRTQGWHFLKFRHLRHLIGSVELSRETWEQHLDADPIEQPKRQPGLF